MIPEPMRRIAMKRDRRQVIKELFGGMAMSLLPKSAAAADDSSAPKPPIRIGQIGVGHPHASKLAVFRQSPDYEVVGIVEPDDMLTTS
jgi:hypothetical protein